MDNFKYILFPLPLIQEIFKKPTTGISDIFDVGIYRVSQTLRISEHSAIKQLVYCYYRGGLPKSLQDKLRRLEESEVFYIAMRITTGLMGMNLCQMRK